MRSLVYCDEYSNKIAQNHLLNYDINHFPLELGENIDNKNFFMDKLKILYEFNIKKQHISINQTTLPNDIAFFEDKAYLIYEECNSLIIMDINKEDNIISIPLGNYPHSIYIDKKRKLAYISNMMENSINIIDCNNNTLVRQIYNIKNPTKILLSNDNTIIYACETCLDNESCGNIVMINPDNSNLIRRISVGRLPTDIYEDEGYLYITNLGDGSMSVISLNKMKEILKIKVGGMPGSLKKYRSKIYIKDYYDDGIYEMDLKEYEIKKIALGK